MDKLQYKTVEMENLSKVVALSFWDCFEFFSLVFILGLLQHFYQVPFIVHIILIVSWFVGGNVADIYINKKKIIYGNI